MGIGAELFVSSKWLDNSPASLSLYSPSPGVSAETNATLCTLFEKMDQSQNRLHQYHPALLLELLLNGHMNRVRVVITTLRMAISKAVTEDGFRGPLHVPLVSLFDLWTDQALASTNQHVYDDLFASPVLDPFSAHPQHTIHEAQVCDVLKCGLWHLYIYT